MEKNTYIAPKIEAIILDNEISLALESMPPAGPFESALTKSHHNSDCFKNGVI